MSDNDDLGQLQAQLVALHASFESVLLHYDEAQACIAALTTERDALRADRDSLQKWRQELIQAVEAATSD